MKHAIATFLFLLSTLSSASWRRDVVKDEMDDRKTLAFTTYAVGHHGADRLTVMCTASKQLVVFISTPNTILEAVPKDGLLVRFDHDEPGRLPWDRGTDYKSVSSGLPRELVSDYLLNSKTFKIELLEYPGGLHTVTFNVSGLEPLIKGHCGL